MTGRAILFDLDETLYRERRFALSGFAAVARDVERDFELPREEVFGVLARALRRGRRAGAFQDLCCAYGLPASRIPFWVAAYRAHEPRLRLSRTVGSVLRELRRTWRVGVLTNGLPQVQAAKVRALGIEPLVDVVSFAQESGPGKPDPEPFLEVLARLGAEPSRAVFAGDDVVRDICGARGVGMRTVLIAHGCENGSAAEADAVVRSLAEVPAIAERLLSRKQEAVHVH